MPVGVTPPVDSHTVTAVDPRAELASHPVSTGRGFWFLVGQYVALTKPRIIELLLTTTLPVMFLAAGGVPPLGTAAWTMLGGLQGENILFADLEQWRGALMKSPWVRDVSIRRSLPATVDPMPTTVKRDTGENGMRGTPRSAADLPGIGADRRSSATSAVARCAAIDCAL